jgi:SAM-dependent methyltransferase
MDKNLYPREEQHNRYPMFKDMFGEVEDSTVLDYGGNTANLLHFSEGAIKEENYTCIDMEKEALSIGKKDFPKAEFLKYNKYNWAYNHNGNYHADYPTLRNESVDYIFSYSVFSHSDFLDLLLTIQWMKTLSPRKIALSIVSTEDKVLTNWFWQRRVQEYGSCVDFRSNIAECKSTFTLFDNNFIVENTLAQAEYDSTHMLTIYNPDWLVERLATEGFDAEIVRPRGSYASFVII